jgi:hypothetical protein
MWATAIILLEQYTRNSFWTTSDVGLIFDSLMTLKEWFMEKQDDIWHHDGIESLDINKNVLKFLQTGIQDGDDVNSEQDMKEFHRFILSCLDISLEKRLDPVDALLSSFFKQGAPLAAIESDWVEGPILASDVLDPNTIDNVNSKSQQDINGLLKGLPIAQIYNLWKLAGGDVELDLVKRGVFLSTPVIKRLPRVCLMPDGAEIGEKVTDTAQLYSDAIYVLSFKELYQRLEEGKKSTTGDRFEWDTDYFMLVDENDVNFLLADNSDQESTTSSANDALVQDSDMLFTDEPLSGLGNVSSGNSGMPTPTTPSSSLSQPISAGMGRSRSTSSLSMNSVTSVPNQQSTVPKLPLFLREQDVNYQYYRQTLFSELLRQYPASRKEIMHHAKVDIPPLLRGKVWAAVLGVKGDLNHVYDGINKFVDMGADRQVCVLSV